VRSGLTESEGQGHEGLQGHLSLGWILLVS
jgi:hypothetical protein